jgi:DMSO/TMAO reductase YedYZ molybdopterin-dependent catalytic subunit
VTIRSATGWTASIPLADAAACLLATDVAGEPLPLANGAPVRLVAPNRRGLEWVKWVREVVVE